MAKKRTTRTTITVMATDWIWSELQADVGRLDEAVSAAEKVLDIVDGQEAWDNVVDLVRFVIGDIARVNANLLMKEVIERD